MRNRLHQAFNDEELVVEADFEKNEIEVLGITQDGESTGKTTSEPQLKKVVITHVYDSNHIEKIWIVNLEKNIPGISGSGSRTERAILVLQRRTESKYVLNVILVELKTDLKKRKKGNSIQQIAKKLRDSMNYMYLLLTLNNHQIPQKDYINKSIELSFKGIVFYNRSQIKENDLTENDEKELYQILHRSKNPPTMTCETIINQRDKIEVIFVQNPGQQGEEMEEMSITLLDIIG
jgi:hypothetical protein